MVLPEELISAIKRRASTRGQTITAYVAELVQRDLGQPVPVDHHRLAEQVHELQRRVERLETGHRSAGPPH